MSPSLRQVAAGLSLCVATFLPATAFAAPLEAGEVPPPSVGTDAQGHPVLLGDYEGKAIVISFWATWCEYCLKELPILEGIQKVAGKDRIQVIAINTESREIFLKAAHAMSSLSLEVTNDPGHTAFKAYGVHGIPHMVIIGRDGRIVHVYQGYDERRLKEIVADINRAIAPS